MRHGSLFSGMGGFDLAAEWMGWENVFHCEWNAFGQKILKHYWPNAISYEDITKTDFTIHRGSIDILTGGFPCQPYSMAGKRLGKDDDRHLWPEMLRAIREIQPTWVVGENVFGLINWSGGLVFHQVQADLEAQGYEVQPYVLPACAVNAPHRRDRIWFVAQNPLHSGCVHRGDEQKGTKVWEQRNTCTGSADGFYLPKGNATYTHSNGLNKCDSNNEVNTSQGRVNALGNAEQGIVNGDVTNTTINGVYETKSIIEHPNSIGQKWGMHKNESKTSIREQFSKRNAQSNESTNWQNFPTVSPICNGDDGISAGLDTSAISFSKWRNESIKAAGNAVVPQVVYQIFKAISQC